MRAIAVYGLGLIGGAAAVPPVLAGCSDSAGAVRVAALDAIYRLQQTNTFGPASERAAVTCLRRVLSNDEPALRARAATAMSVFTTGPLRGAAAGALADAYRRESDGYVRWHEMWALYRGFAAIAPHAVLVAGLHDRDEVVRIEAVRAFGRRGDRADAVLLEPLARDASWRVQEQALESIRVLQGGAMTEHLKEIPVGIHTPAPVPDAFAHVAALQRPEDVRRAAPDPASIPSAPPLKTATVAGMTGPSPGRHPWVRIVTTAGNIYVELYPEWAPLTVENFLNLSNNGYYDGNPWFRIVPDFVVQSGDPSANATGPGYTIPAEENPIEQDSYVISMGLDYTDPPNAHAKRDSAGSEFYITLSPQLHLNADFTVFGRVTSGFDVLGRLVESDKIQRIERLPDRP